MEELSRNLSITPEFVERLVYLSDREMTNYKLDDLLTGFKYNIEFSVALKEFRVKSGKPIMKLSQLKFTEILDEEDPNEEFDEI